MTPATKALQTLVVALAACVLLPLAGAATRAIPAAVTCPASIAAPSGTYTPYSGDPLRGPDGFTQTIRDLSQYPDSDYLETTCQWRIKGQSLASIDLRWSTSSSYQLLGSCTGTSEAYFQVASTTHKAVSTYSATLQADRDTLKQIAHQMVAGAEHLAAPCKETGTTGGGTLAGATAHPWRVFHAEGYIGRDKDNGYYITLGSVHGAGSATAGPQGGAVTKATGSLRIEIIATRTKTRPNGLHRSFTLVIGKGGRLTQLASGFRLVLPIHVSPSKLADADLDCLAEPDGTMTLVDGRGSGDFISLGGICGFTSSGSDQVDAQIG
jgi:hypothetical protein